MIKYRKTVCVNMLTGWSKEKKQAPRRTCVSKHKSAPRTTSYGHLCPLLATPLPAPWLEPRRRKPPPKVRCVALYGRDCLLMIFVSFAGSWCITRRLISQYRSSNSESSAQYP
jgi:hypothetical protein